jgi:CRISPR-associated protein Csb2
MTLVLEIEYLSGVSYAAIGPDSAVPDWPPQSDRVFSALVASWGAHGQRDDESGALMWLEQLPPPLLIERGALERTAPIVFVPPNDPRISRRAHARGVLPALRRRQPRRFPATRPLDPVLRFVWPDATPEPVVLTALTQLARDTSYVGHSSSLTRCRFLLEPDERYLSAGSTAQLRIYPGRFEELRDAYKRFEQSANGSDRPQKGAPVARPPTPSPHRMSQFADRWLVLEHVGGTMPDVRACALVAKTIRDSLLAGYQRIGLGDQIPEVISGHSASGAATRLPHVAIVPLPFVGFDHADGHVLGFGIVPPEDGTLLQHQDFRRVLRRLAPMNEDRGRRILTLTTKEGTPSEQAFSIQLSPSFEAERQSLDPALYVARARTFATVTPIALDRHLKERGAARQSEIETQVAAACRNIGLPEPLAVVADKYSAIDGTVSAYPPGNSPKWLRWHLPQSLASRQLTHALIRFPVLVDGPVILGAGRFLGLGLCRPLDPER